MRNYYNLLDIDLVFGSDNFAFVSRPPENEWESEIQDRYFKYLEKITSNHTKTPKKMNDLNKTSNDEFRNIMYENIYFWWQRGHRKYGSSAFPDFEPKAMLYLFSTFHQYKYRTI